MDELTDEQIDANFTAATAPALDALKALDYSKPLSPDQVEVHAIAARILDQSKQTALESAEALLASRTATARRLYADDPVDNAQRQADLLETQMLASTVTTKVEASNKLLPLAWQALGVGQLNQAGVYQRAAALKGVTDANLDRMIELERSSVYPNRRAALKDMADAERAYRKSWAKVQVAEGVGQQLLGRPERAVTAHLNLKMYEAMTAWNEGRPIRGDAELGITYPDNGPKNYRVDYRVRGVDELSK